MLTKLDVDVLVPLVVPGPFEASEWEPITITAVEGLKQCAYFIYQSADEEGLWRRDGLGDVFARLKARLISLLAGFDTAPAGWGANELAARAHRTGL